MDNKLRCFLYDMIKNNIIPYSVDKIFGRGVYSAQDSFFPLLQFFFFFFSLLVFFKQGRGKIEKKIQNSLFYLYYPPSHTLF